jgi:Pyruvate/2-oxoacid:ferredoxin oxidoreductase gamma subunit
LDELARYAARVERELIMTGIGGQGVQIAVRALARAATATGRNIMLFGMFGGSVRGGKTEATLVVSDEEIEAPPILARTWSAVALHPKFFDTVAPRIADDGLTIVNSSLMSHPGALEVPISAIAEELGNVGLAGMVALGAYVAASELVTLDAAIEGMKSEIPAYRAHRIPENELAIARGAEAVVKV